jgi:hypothetical protein
MNLTRATAPKSEIRSPKSEFSYVRQQVWEYN